MGATGGIRHWCRKCPEADEPNQETEAWSGRVKDQNHPDKVQNQQTKSESRIQSRSQGQAAGKESPNRSRSKPYNVFPKLEDTRKRWIVGVSVAVLLALILVAGTLIGVYMTQKHTEQMVTVAFANAEGEKITQKVSVNEREEVAAIYVRSDKYPGTFLFDYKKKLIAFRKPNTTKCFVLRMDETKTPTLSALLKGVEYFRTHDATGNDKVAYNFQEVEEANSADVGSNVFLMCSDANIFWAKNVKSRQLSISLEGAINILGLLHIEGQISIWL